MILNDSSLFSASADITTKEILKRYGDRARAPSGTPAPAAETSVNSPGPRSKESRQSAGVTRVDIDPNQATAWQNESSVRHVGGVDGMGTPLPPYAANNNGSTESHGSPTRHSYRSSAYDKQRIMGVT